MTVALSFTELDILDALRNFLLAILPPGVDVIQGQDNRVAEPLADDYVVMTTMGQVRLATNVDSYDPSPDATTMTSMESAQVTVQLDLHGDNSAANATRIAMVWRSPWGCSFLRGSIIAPLYADEPRQVPFSNGEEQYEYRWIVTLYLQARPALILPQDYATDLSLQTVLLNKLVWNV